MAKGESWHETFALSLVFLTLSKNETDSENSPQAMLQLSRFDELIAFESEDLGQGLRARKKQPFFI